MDRLNPVLLAGYILANNFSDLSSEDWKKRMRRSESWVFFSRSFLVLGMVLSLLFLFKDPLGATLGMIFVALIAGLSWMFLQDGKWIALRRDVDDLIRQFGPSYNKEYDPGIKLLVWSTVPFIPELRGVIEAFLKELGARIVALEEVTSKDPNLLREQLQLKDLRLQMKSAHRIAGNFSLVGDMRNYFSSTKKK